MTKKVIIVGSGNAALSAGIAALEKGANVTSDTERFKILSVIEIK